MKDILNENDNYTRLPRNYSMYVDWYEFTMDDALTLAQKHDKQVVFDVFFRKVPNNGSYCVMAGLDKIIEYIKNLRFDLPGDEEFLKSCGLSDECVKYFKNFKFKGDIKAIPDGTPIFPNEPVLTVRSSILEADIMEAYILTVLNGAVSHATGARRIVESVPKDVQVIDVSNISSFRDVMEFGARRADGPEAGIDASIYGVMAGCVGTSNTLAARMMGMEPFIDNRINKENNVLKPPQLPLGTMAHLFVESFDENDDVVKDEFESFKAFVNRFPNKAILLVDTYDTLHCGIPNAIKTFNYMKEKGMPLNNIGIRIDSGDLEYLTKEARKMLDEAGFPQASICISNALNGKKLTALRNGNAKFDSIGAGDNISKPEGNVGFVYKLVATEKNNEWNPRIKLSEDEVKIINPGYKKLYRAYDNNTGYALCDVMTLEDEVIDKDELAIFDPTDPRKNKLIRNFNLRELQRDIVLNGVLVYTDPTIKEKRDYCNAEMAKIYPEIRREESPEVYKVSGTQEYIDVKSEVIRKIKSKINERKY